MTRICELFDLTGRVAIVTGGGGLLGGKFVEALAAAGATVYSVDLSDERLAAVRESCPPDLRARVKPTVLDITVEPDVESGIRRVREESGSIDIVVNSAAVDPKFEPGALNQGESPGAFTSYSLENWRRSMEVNLTGAFLVTRACCRFMEQAESGVVVNISSTYGLVGPDQRIYENPEANGESRFFKPVDYSVTKAGMLGFTRALAAYYQGRGIRVNALSPGGTFNDNPESFVERYSYRTITGRMARPDDYVGAIVYLCSDASAYMTGSNLVVDGGWTAL
jgi:NAD(P)-dependent dehydrogenase (short-subunit alcohol dehydrogenase family)